MVRRAEPEGAAASPEAVKPAAAAPSTSGDQVDTKKAEAQAPILAKGQGTAIVTGVISAGLGIAYLALVWVMDQRGGQLLPPPPEAFIP